MDQDANVHREIWQSAGMSHALPQLAAGGDSDTIITALEDWVSEKVSSEKPIELLVVAWSGHGILHPKSENGELFLVTNETPPTPGARNAVRISDVALTLAPVEAQHTLLIVDTCHAEAGTDEFIYRLKKYQPAGVGRIAVLSAARTAERAEDGFLARGLYRLLRTGQAADPAAREATRSWGDKSRFITCGQLQLALQQLLDIDEPADGTARNSAARLQHISLDISRGDAYVFPNPHFDPDAPEDELVEDRMFRLGDLSHFIDKARSSDDGSWRFTGRDPQIDAISTWLATGPAELCAVVGPAGTGKSSLLGHVAALSDPDQRSVMQAAGFDLRAAAMRHRIPPDHAIDLAIHSRNKTADDLVDELVQRLSIPASPNGHSARTVAEHIQATRKALTPFTILIDALDEAGVADRGTRYERSSHEATAIARRVLRPLCDAGIRLLVGTRPGPGPDDVQGQILEALEADRVVTLTADAVTEADIERYVTGVLTADGAKYAGSRGSDGAHRSDDDVTTIAAEIARRAKGRFLYAAMTARAVAHPTSTLDLADLNWRSSLADDIGQAIVTELVALYPDERQRQQAHEVLAGLAWAQGAGVPAVRVWPLIATVVSDLGRGDTYGRNTIDQVLRTAGRFISETSLDGEALYRLYHEELATYFLRSPVLPPSGAHPLQVDDQAVAGVHRRIARQLLSQIDVPSHCRTDLPYAARHLANHAHIGGMLDVVLLQDGHPALDLISNLDPTSVATVRSSSDRPISAPSAQIVAATRRIRGDLLQTIDSRQRGALLLLELHKQARNLVERWDPKVSLPWRPRWASWQASSPHDLLQGHISAVVAVTVGVVDGKDRIISASNDGTVRVWDLQDPTRPVVLEGHTGAGVAVTVGVMDGKSRVISASNDGTVRVWDLQDPTGPVVLDGRTGAGVAVAVGVVDGKSRVISAGNDEMVRVWDLDDPTPVLLDRHTGVVVVTMGVVDGKVRAISASRASTVRVWDLADHTRPVVLRGHTDAVVAVAVGVVDGKDRIISASNDGTVRVWDLDSPTGPVVLEGHTGVVAVTVGVVDGKDRVVSASNDGTVQVWDLADPTRPFPLEGHTDAVVAVTVGVVDGKSRVISASRDATVRVWDLEDPTRPAILKGHPKPVVTATMGIVYGKQRVISGSYDHTVRVWDLEDPTRPIVLRGHTGPVVAVGVVDGKNRIISGSHDHTVRVWDLEDPTRPIVLRGQTDLMDVMTVGMVDGRNRIIFARDNTVRVWDLEDPTRPVVLRGHTDAVMAVAVGVVDGKDRIISASDVGTVRVWDLEDPTRAVVLEGHANPVSSVTVGVMDGKDRVVSASWDGTLRVWDLEDATRPVVLRGHTDAVMAVAVGVVDGKSRVISASWDGTVRVWNLAGDCVDTLPMGAPISAMATNASTLVLACSAGLAVIGLEIDSESWQAPEVERGDSSARRSD